MLKNEAPPTALVAVARLDADGVYRGIDQLPADQVTADHVPLPDGCDLPPGKYAWDRTKASFMPLAGSQQRAVAAPVALNALAWGLLVMSGGGATRLPSACESWLDSYVGSIDFAGSADSDADKQLLADYMTTRGLK